MLPRPLSDIVHFFLFYSPLRVADYLYAEPSTSSAIATIFLVSAALYTLCLLPTLFADLCAHSDSRLARSLTGMALPDTPLATTRLTRHLSRSDGLWKHGESSRRYPLTPD